MKEVKLEESAYQFNAKMSLKQAIPLGLQHVCAMFVGNLTPLLIITSACGIAGGEFADLQVTLLQSAMFVGRTRATSAKETIAMWPSVRRGEDRNIFPNQEKADVMFNSALVYELSVLKLYAEPLLFQIEEGEPEYQEAKRLLKFLDYFVGVPIEDIPKNSILREFVGGSCFDV